MAERCSCGGVGARHEKGCAWNRDGKEPVEPHDGRSAAMTDTLTPALAVLTERQRKQLARIRVVRGQRPLLPVALQDDAIAIIDTLTQALAERDAQLARLKDDIEHGRCCDDFERLPGCGHPRCVVSEVCELCVEIGEKTSALDDKVEAAEAKLRAVEALHFKSELNERCAHDGAHWPCPTSAILTNPTTDACTCAQPLIGERPGVGPRCRLCNKRIVPTTEK
jgi:hypothetical protein